MKKLFVGCLSYDVTSDMLAKAFGTIGEVTDAFVPTDKETQSSKGFGLVTFANPEDAAKALNEKNGADLYGRKIRIQYANDQTDRGRGGRGRGDSGFRGGRGRGDSGFRGGRGDSGFRGGRGGDRGSGFRGSRGGDRGSSFGGGSGGGFGGRQDSWNQGSDALTNDSSWKGSSNSGSGKWGEPKESGNSGKKDRELGGGKSWGSGGGSWGSGGSNQKQETKGQESGSWGGGSAQPQSNGLNVFSHNESRGTSGNSGSENKEWGSGAPPQKRYSRDRTEQDEKKEGESQKSWGSGSQSTWGGGSEKQGYKQNERGRRDNSAEKERDSCKSWNKSGGEGKGSEWNW